ncbi:hypothetical protein VZT92_002409 [Zoarces viviparus]|uniref:Immunoglobulin domain-containing protein n=1 Tax=Zoarces viviparus TaxID=48416 RepID=A0AAW1G061_ZOAVI
MIQIYANTCLLSALSLVEMKPLYINGRVGESVTIKCSDWNVWTNVKENVKYFCDSPCFNDHHIIVKAAYGDTTFKNRLKLYNEGKSLVVTFMNLQKSDSKTYLCGVERSGLDSHIKVILNVKEVTYSSTMSSNFSDIITDMSNTTLNTTTATAPATPGSERSVPYVVIGVIAIITVLMVLLKLISKMMKRQLNVVSGADTRRKDTQESAGPDEVYQSLHHLTTDKDEVYGTLTPTERSAGPDEVYQSLRHLTMDKGQVYGTLTPTKRVWQSTHLRHNFE